MKLWKTVRLGMYPRTIPQLKSTLNKRDSSVLRNNNYLDYFIHHYSAASEEIDIDLVLVSAEDLGLNQKTVYIHQVYQQAQWLGLKLCSVEVGPQLFLQAEETCFSNKQHGEHIMIGMSALSSLGAWGDNIFGIRCSWTDGHGKYYPPGLTTIIASAFQQYFLKSKWVFIKPR